jgi:2-hydroxychromene-2-carboxylate isomerase
MARELDFFFFYGSTYTYLSVMRVANLASAADLTVRWRPFNVRQIMIETNNIPFGGKPAKAAYMWRDIARRAAGHRVAFPKPPVYPVDPDLVANLVGVVAAEQGWCPEYTKASYEAWFLQDKGLGIGNNVAEVLESLGKDPSEILALANSDATRSKFDEETDVARRLGIFGSPTFAVGEEIFWGDDRLEDALEWTAAALPPV